MHPPFSFSTCPQFAHGGLWGHFWEEVSFLRTCSSQDLEGLVASDILSELLPTLFISGWNDKDRILCWRASMISSRTVVKLVRREMQLRAVLADTAARGRYSVLQNPCETELLFFENPAPWNVIKSLSLAKKIPKWRRKTIANQFRMDFAFFAIVGPQQGFYWQLRFGWENELRLGLDNWQTTKIHAKLTCNCFRFSMRKIQTKLRISVGFCSLQIEKNCDSILHRFYTLLRNYWAPAVRPTFERFLDNIWHWYRKNSANSPEHSPWQPITKLPNDYTVTAEAFTRYPGNNTRYGIHTEVIM